LATPEVPAYYRRILLTSLALARLFAGEPDAARTAFAEALRLSLTDAHATGLGQSFAGIAAIAAIDGDDEAAARLRGAARAAGYPPGDSDRATDERLTRNYLTAAQTRLGPAAWQRHEAIGAAWTTSEATTFAITWVGVRAPAPP
jgi:hypothetical protein